MPQNRVDLVNIFQSVTRALVENQQNLDQADTYNQDHGSNMVQTFQTITNALEQKKGSSDSAALAYAAKSLSKRSASSSGKLYAQNLNLAAAQFKGKKVDEQGAMELLQTLIGSSQAGQPASSQPAGGDMLGALLGGLTGSTAPAQQNAPAAGDDMLGMLLGGLTGAGGSQNQQQTQPGQQGELGLQNLLAGGLAYLQAKQSGQGNMQALIQAFAAGSGMGNSTHRTESTQVVIQAFLQALSSMKRAS
jgi:hypothetical protein